MSTDPDAFDLPDLAAESGVSPRTIRYYVQQGLIPSPGTRGPNTRYDRGHLDRLQLIRRLQRQHLPLAEIRRRLDELDDAGVRAALATLPPDPPKSSALDYVRQVLAGGQPVHWSVEAPPVYSATPAPGAARSSVARPEASAARAAPELSAPPPTIEAEEATVSRSFSLRTPPAAAEPDGVADESSAASAAWSHPNPLPKRPPRSQWERLTLDPDIELHIRRPLSREGNRRVERLLDAARRIFSEEP